VKYCITILYIEDNLFAGFVLRKPGIGQGNKVFFYMKVFISILFVWRFV